MHRPYRRSRPRIEWFIPMGFLISASVQAELEWKQKEITLEALPTQICATAVFEFTNTGDKKETIADVRISCGCLSINPYKTEYAPGETGRLVVVFDFKNRTGKQNKTLMIETGNGKVVELSLSAEIPLSYQIEPRLIVWKKGDTTESKTIRLTNPNAEPIKLLSISSSNEKIQSKLVPIRDGFEYEAQITRQPEARNARSVIRIITEPPPDETASKTLKLYAISE